MRTITILTIAFMALNATGCAREYHNSGTLFSGKTVVASDKYVTEAIPVEEFEKISVSGSFDVSYTQRKGAPHVEVYTSDNIIGLLDIQVKDDALCIGFKKNVRVKYDKLEVRVSSEKMEGMSIAGSGDVETKGAIKSEKLKISVAGSGDFKGGNIACTDLNISIAGSGDITLQGITCEQAKTSIAGSGNLKLYEMTTGEAEAGIAGSGDMVLTGSADKALYSISGSGSIKATDFVAKRVEAATNGSGDIQCHATEFIKARSNGSGTIGYKGNPEVDFPNKKFYKIDE